MKHHPKRILSLLLSLCLVLSLMPVMVIGADAASTKTIYFDNSAKNWDSVAVYAWNDNGNCTGGWPGTTMKHVGGSIYSYDVPTDATKIIFNNNNNGAQTGDLDMPTGSKNYYNAQETWAVYSGCTHSYKVTTTAATCTKDGSEVHTCSKCGDQYSTVLKATGHKYSYGVCTVCNYKDTSYVKEYYLIGFINNYDYGYGSDYENMGQYKFVNGKLTVKFESASYVGVKITNNDAFYMTKSYCTDTTATLYNTANLENSDKLYVPGNVEVVFTLKEGANDTLILSYTAAACEHLFSSYVGTRPTCDKTGIRIHTCGYCGYSYEETMAAWGHSYADGACTTCGAADPSFVSPDYYLFGVINGADYGWNNDLSTIGKYKFVDGKLTATFTSDSYVAVKTGDNKNFYMTNGNEGQISSVTLHKFSDPTSVSANRLFVPGGCTVNFTLKVSGSNLILSYTLASSDCKHTQHNSDAICSFCGAQVKHNYSYGVCTICRGVDPNYNPYDYYLFGYINDANYGCDEDYDTLGQYKFVDGKLTARFESNSYIGIKKVDPHAKFGAQIMGWYMTQSYTEDTSATFYSTTTGANEKMFVPGGVTLNFTLTSNDDGTMTLSYTKASQTSTPPTITLKYPTLSFEDVIVMNVYYSISNKTDVKEMGLITFTQKISGHSIHNAEKVIPGYTWSSSDKLYYSSTDGIAAKDLGDTIYFAVYAKLADGTYTYTNLIGYSPKTYAYNLLKTGSTEMKSLVAAMLNYGAAAQQYFNYNPYNLVNADMTADQKALVKAYNSDMIASVALPNDAKKGTMVGNGGYTKRYPTISFEGAFCINYYFVPSAAPKGNITMYYWNQADYNAATSLNKNNATKAITMTKAENGEYMAVVSGIAAKDLDSGVYVAFCYSDGTTSYCSGVIGYSIGAYCKNQASATGTLANLAAATAVYGYYAKQVFA